MSLNTALIRSGVLVCSPGANPSHVFSPFPEVSSTTQPSLNSFLRNSNSLGRSHVVPLRPHLTAVAPSLAPQTLSVPFHRPWRTCQKSPLPLRVSFSWCRLCGLECHATLAHLMKGFGGRKLESMGSFYF